MKSLIIANWKMNPATEKEALELFNSVKKGVKNVKNAEVVICPPFIYLPLLKGITLGAQNVFFKEKGTFTGEVSPLMLKDLKVSYVIVGHSESRRYLHETDEMINKKLKEVLAVKLKPIFCIGESEGQEKSQVLEQQIRDGLKGISAREVGKVIIAYEPVWAIGTGNNCSIEETISSVLLIRKIISKLYNLKVAEKISILYGGSVDSSNASSYLKEVGVDGLLVGGASLNAQDFIKMVESASEKAKS